jgi:hypothetical protein
MSSKIKVATIEAVAKKQARDGQFKPGDTEQQYAAQFIEMYLTNFATIMANSNEKETLTAAAINALRDIQVRDYAMGLVNDDNITSVMAALSHMVMVTPKKYISAPASLLSVIYYETGQTERALATLGLAKQDYALAQLLNRCFTTGWAPTSFKSMRKELHPQVVGTIFGDN